LPLIFCPAGQREVATWPRVAALLPVDLTRIAREVGLEDGSISYTNGGRNPDDAPGVAGRHEAVARPALFGQRLLCGAQANGWDGPYDLLSCARLPPQAP
jgi:hypothetical protein